MNEVRNDWYAVGAIWLILALLLATMAGSVALVFTAFAHRDELPHIGRAIAAPLPPTVPARATDVP